MFKLFRKQPLTKQVIIGTTSLVVLGGTSLYLYYTPKDEKLKEIMNEMNSNKDGNLHRYVVLSRYYRDKGHVGKFSSHSFVKLATEKLPVEKHKDVETLFQYYTNGIVSKALETGAWNRGTPITYSLLSTTGKSCEEATVFAYLTASHIARLNEDENMKSDEFKRKSQNTMEFYKIFAQKFLLPHEKCNGYYLPPNESAKVLDEIVRVKYSSNPPVY
jgi:hypothetical protein